MAGLRETYGCSKLHESHFPALLTAIPSMTERLVRVLIDRKESTREPKNRYGNLAALSKLAGNLAHELNNPASAARSAALTLSQNSELAKSDARYQLGLKLQNHAAVDRIFKNWMRFDSASVSHAGNSMPAGELEDALSDWLRDKGLEEVWKLAPIAELSGEQL